MRYDFDWNPEKNRANVQKHGISFRQAASVFRDPNQISAFDEAHSNTEDRWVTLGLDSAGILRVVVHTFEQTAEEIWKIRMISARKANRDEENQYNQMNR
ncbi:MAG: BrnT family toxin [Anaerolineales bacterium]